MVSSGLLRRVALVRTDVSEERSSCIIRETRIARVRRLLVNANIVLSSPNFVTLKIEATSSSKTSVVTRATRRNIPEDGILNSHRRENFRPRKIFLCYMGFYYNLSAEKGQEIS
jgi:hypothetical protein